MKKETYLTFTLDKEVFAVNVVNVLEVLEQQLITTVPKAPEFILGIINFRGQILPVINTRKKFNLLVDDESLKTFVIVFESTVDEEKQLVAATADAVNDVIEISPDEIKSLPELGLNYDARFINGVIRLDNKFILLLNSEKVFSHSQNEVVAINKI